MAATAIPEQLFNASDIAVVGNFTRAERTAALAAVGANSSIIGLIVNLFIGIVLGANVVIAHAIGHGDRETVTKAVHTSILVSVLGGTMVALLYRQLRRTAMDTSIWSQSSFVSTSRSCGAFCVLACRPASRAPCSPFPISSSSPPSIAWAQWLWRHPMRLLILRSSPMI